MSVKDMYEKFGHDYDEFGAIEKYLGDERKFFQTLFEKHGVHSVLDCACGTGQHLYMFSEMGLFVSGSDYSATMLRVAESNLKKHGKSIPLCQCDFRYLEHKHTKTFDALVCLSTSLPHLHTDADLITALKSMKNRLNKNGILVLTQGTTPFTLSLPSVEVVVNNTDFSRVFVKEHDDKFQTIHVLDLFHSASRTESNQYDIVYRIILDDDYRRLLSEAGYEDIRIYGDYEMSEYTAQSKRLIVVAKCTT
ncbi:MAG: methyltransferase domain-containing protein [Bacteroidales bacterium]|jgi:ubiquinone/menaquinone biosynthesis C-methylase UbiE|nr:methyltransferase domain-containing protein [Bacteroidales bacterium]